MLDKMRKTKKNKKRTRLVLDALLFHLTNGILIQCDILSGSIFFSFSLDQVKRVITFACRSKVSSFVDRLVFDLEGEGEEILSFFLSFLSFVRSLFLIDNDTQTVRL
jgi:hypothetical protein